MEGSNQQGEQIAEAQVEQQGLDQMEELNEEAENEEDMEEVEDQDNEDLAGAVGSWPGYNIRVLRKMVPECLNSVKPVLIWKFWTRTERMMRAYREGYAYGTADFKEMVTKTYRSHRRVSNSQTIVYN